MRVDGPSNPFHIARAYGVPAAAPARVEASRSADAVARIEPVRREPGPMDRLVAGVVPGAIDFSGETPAPSAGAALAMYRNPAAKNAAATGVETGRRVDLSA